jgi:biogenesis of lysosome-related organelles complex 1 subunit KXD1
VSLAQKVKHRDSDSDRSGTLNAKNRQLMELQARAQQKFAEMQASFAEGIKTARDVQKDLEWTQKKVE